jgi:hypothetical protein
MTIWRMRIAYWIPKAIWSLSEYVTLMLFHCNNGCTNAPPCYDTRTTVSDLLWFLLLQLHRTHQALFQTRCSVYHPDSNMGGDEAVSHTAGEAQWSCYCLLASRLRLDWTAAVCLSTLRDRHRLGGVFCDIGGCLFRNWEAIAANSLRILLRVLRAEWHRV